MFKLFKQRLLETGIPANNIISIALDDDQQRELRDPYALSDYVRQRCTNPQEKYVLLLDEIQYAIAKDELKNTNEPVKRYIIRLPGVLRELTSSLCSSIGSLTNASKVARTVNSKKGLKTNSETISTYLSYLTDSFLFSKAERYNIKNKRYFEYPSKFYCTDIGLRNVRLGLRQQEETHIMENLIYNELRMRGFAVDVGNIDVFEKNASGKPVQKNLEVDFIARKGSRKYYIQSALSMDDKAKEQTELRPFDAIDDSFTKIVISKSYGKRWFNKKGILRLGILDFLLDTFLLDNQR